MNHRSWATTEVSLNDNACWSWRTVVMTAPTYLVRSESGSANNEEQARQLANAAKDRMKKVR